jgi:hypothetical protein
MVQYRSLHRLRYMTGQLSMNGSAPPGEDSFRAVRGEEYQAYDYLQYSVHQSLTSNS